jgi:hypothetical protein
MKFNMNYGLENSITLMLNVLVLIIILRLRTRMYLSEKMHNEVFRYNVSNLFSTGSGKTHIYLSVCLSIYLPMHLTSIKKMKLRNS